MNIKQPKRQAIYSHLTKDTKEGLSQLAKYHRTTLTNLIEEGANMVIRSHLKQIQLNQYNQQQVSGITTHLGNSFVGL